MDKIKGDLLKLAEEGKFDVIVQGCNCFHKMGSGLAKQIAAKYPVAERADFYTKRGDISKLGNFSQATINLESSHQFIIINAYTQYKWSGSQDVFEYKAFETFLNRLCLFIVNHKEVVGRKVNVGFPMIGCGYARGDKTRIIPMIEKFANDVKSWGEVTVVSYVFQ